MGVRRGLIRCVVAACLMVAVAVPSVVLAQGRGMADLSGDGIADEITVTPTAEDAAVLSVRLGGGGGAASLAVGWCRGCGPVYAVFHTGMLDGDDLMVFSPDRQALRWMQWWGGKLIEQRVIPLNGEGRAIEAFDAKTVNVRLRNADMMTLSF